MDYPALAFDDPRMQGLLGFAGGLLQAGGASPYPVGLGQAFGQGIQGMQSAQQAAAKMRQADTLIDLEKQKTEMSKQQLKAAQDKQQIAADIAARVQQWQQQQNTPPSVVLTPQAQAAQQQQVRGNFPLNLGDVLQAKAVGLDYLPEYKEAQPNISVQSGFLVDPRQGVVGSVPQTNQQGFSTMTVRDASAPGGFRVVQVPGAAEAFGQQQDIGARTSARYDLQTVPPTGPNTPPTFRSRLDLLGTAQAPGAAPAPQAAGMAPTEQAAQAARAAQQQSVSQNYGSIFNNYQNAALAAPGRISNLRRLDSLLGDFEGGKLSQTGLNLASVANSAGVRVDKNLPNKEAAAALTNAMALELRNTADGHGMPGSMSDADREFLKSMAPRFDQTAKGRKLIIETQTKILERQQAVADMARKYRAKYGVIDDNFFSQLQGWSNKYPIFGKQE